MKTVVVFSGGLDSTVLLTHLMSKGHECHALSIWYGQRHATELAAAAKVVDALRAAHNISVEALTHRVLDLPQLRDVLGGSSQTSDLPVPHGHYAEESMKQTVVPNRNMILLAIATGYAVSLKANALAYGAHRGDHDIYPDCRPEFVTAMQRAVSKCDYGPPVLMAPFMHVTKAEIVKKGSQLFAPMQYSYSCYEGDATHCGQCGTCVERKEAFQLAGVADPTVYKGTPQGVSPKLPQ